LSTTDLTAQRGPLLAGPIGFTRTADNFEAVDGDAVQGESDDGANTAGGLPDDLHASNANMSTPPDGTSPRMQMSLINPGARFLAGNSGDESDVVYHEYTHGLSNRLVVDANGFSTLNGSQADAMGEGWSDWYAEDFLVSQGLEKDTAAGGDIRVGKYWTSGGTIRTQPLDGTVGAPATACPGTPTARTVVFGGHASGFGGGLVATTAADGTYTISGILPGTYAKVVARGVGGYDPTEKTVSVPSHPLTQDWTVRRDWGAERRDQAAVEGRHRPAGDQPAWTVRRSGPAEVPRVGASFTRRRKYWLRTPV
jgi:hypothetical protein